MKALLNLVNQILSRLIIVISSLLVICVVWQVLSRYVLASPSTATDELARFLFMWVGLLAAAYGVNVKSHLAIDLLTMNLTGKRKAVSELIIEVAIALFAAVAMVYGGIGLVTKTLETGQISPAMGLEMGYIYLCLPISGVLILFYSIVNIWEQLTFIASPEAKA
ncbi:MAG: TRAP transporter small permease [Gammaproteobacteria bacterium]|nr:TRAP transporter small permease [Gammaproteobacteria bacterium]